MKSDMADDALNNETVQKAFSLVDDAKLPHPAGPLLASFIAEALNPRLAADFVLQHCHRSQDKYVTLSTLSADWASIVDGISQSAGSTVELDAATRAAIVRRDGNRCCITGKQGTWRDPLRVVPILPVPDQWLSNEPRRFNMLGAFFTPPYRDWWLAYAQRPDDMYAYHSHWLLRSSATRAFAQGLVKLDRIQPSMIEYEVNHVAIGALDKPIEVYGSFALLGDHSRSRLEKVDARFPGTQARLAPSFRWRAIAREINKNTALESTSLKIPAGLSTSNIQVDHHSYLRLTSILLNVCLVFWLLIPGDIRIATYNLLRKIGYRMYGASINNATVQRLPFGLYLKYNGNPDNFRNECNALRVVRQYTSIPVPQPLDFVVSSRTPEDDFDDPDAYILMTRIPGLPLSRCQDLLSDKDTVAFTTQLQGYLEQLRAIPKTVSPKYAICNTLGKACSDTRIRNGDPIGPFTNEAAFSKLLRNSDEPSRRDHNILFTHADLNSRNILVDRIRRPDGTSSWHITGIVDWENSGYYPEYWDYTKSLYEGFRYTQRWRDIMHDVFRVFGDYSKEFEVEQRSWEEGDYI